MYKKAIGYSLLSLILSLSTRTVAWKITFDESAHNSEYEILTFEKESDYKGMLWQISFGSGFIKFIGVVAPLAGKLGESKVGQLSKITGEDGVRTYSDAEVKLIKTATKAATAGLSNLVKSGKLGDLFTKYTKDGYTIDYVKSFKPNNLKNSQCKGASSLKDHVIHKIKSNKDIFFVIIDKTQDTVTYANWGPAYGEFIFKSQTIKAVNSDDEAIIGNLEQLSNDGGTNCSTQGVSIPVSSATKDA